MSRRPRIDGWSFRSSGSAASRIEPLDAFSERMDEALRVAPPRVGTLRWRLETGPRARAVLSADTDELRGWLKDVLIPIYPAGRWTPTPVHDPPSSSLKFGIAHPDSRGPFPAALDGRNPWIDSVLASVLSIPSGGSLGFELHPLGPPTGARVASVPGPFVIQPPGFRAPLPEAAVRSTLDRLEERRLAARWEVMIALGEAGRGGSARPGGGRLARLVETASHRDGGSGVRFRRDRGWWGLSAPTLLLSSAEVAMCLPGPMCRFQPLTEDRPWHSAPLVIGEGLGGRSTCLWVEPDQGRHLVILGETGMGKSTLLLRLATQVSRSAGIVLFDPLGDTARKALSSLPVAARPRVLWVSPKDSPVSINALASASPNPQGSVAHRERTLDDLVNALRRVRESRYGETPFWGPRIEEMVRRALAAASALPSGTLIDAERLLSAPNRMTRGVPPEAQPVVRQLRELVMERPEEVDGARRVLGELAGNATLRRMLCDPRAASTVTQWIEPGRIVVVSGDAGEIGETAARYLLSILLALVWSEALARRPSPKTVLILDEAHWYAHETAAQILRLGRRENVHLWMATQALASLPPAVAEAARTNAADFVMFRGSPDEARLFHRWLPSVSEESMLALASGQAIVMVGKGEDVQWTSMPRAHGPPAIDDALSIARSTSEPYWTKPVPDAPTEGSVPSEIAPRSSPGPLDPEVRRVLLVLWAGLLDADPNPEIEVGLAPLRAALDPGGGTLRVVGSLLARSGVLARVPDGTAGRAWRLAREPFRALFPLGVDPQELERATVVWREISPRLGGSE